MRQAVRPSGGRGVCGAEGSALRIIDTLTNIHFLSCSNTNSHTLFIRCLVTYLLETHALNL